MNNLHFKGLITHLTILTVNMCGVALPGFNARGELETRRLRGAETETTGGFDLKDNLVDVVFLTGDKQKIAKNCVT